MRSSILVLTLLIGLVYLNSNVSAQQIRGFTDLSNATKARELVDFKGVCRLDITDGFFPCDDTVSYVLGRRAASFTFSSGPKMYVLTGIGDRQYNSENFYQVVTAITEWKDSKPYKTHEGLDGFCHLRLNKEATKFFFIKCIVNNPDNDQVYRFYLEEISSFSRK